MSPKKRRHPAPIKLTRGLHCKACDRPIQGDPELCSECLQIARALVHDADPADEDEHVESLAEVQSGPDPK